MRMSLARILPVLLGLLPIATVAHAAEPAWSYSAGIFGYLLPNDSDYLQPTGMADRGRLHLEARYNYEDLGTGSVWAGGHFAGGDQVVFEVTPMLGGVFGATAGVAPGLRASLGWRRIELSSEGEYLLDVRDRGDSFFYTWSELSVAPTTGFRAGLVLQRTRAYESPRDTQTGFLVGGHLAGADFAAYLFNPADDRPIAVLAISASF